MVHLRSFLLLSDDEKKQLQKEFRLCVAGLIKDARKKANISARDLSMLSGIDPSNLSRLERGKQSMSVSVFCRLLYCLGINELGVKIKD